MNREERLKFRRQNQALFASKENGQHQPPELPPPVPQKAPKPKAARKSAAERDAALEQRGRLPDGATICGEYNAKNRRPTSDQP